jgi:hypothetical protein
MNFCQSPMSRFHRAVASCAFVLALPAVMTACGGRNVVLDEEHYTIPPDVIGPGVSVVAEDQQDAIEVAVDAERLVWRSRKLEKANAGYRPSYVRGCRKDDCVSTTITYAHGEIDLNVVANQGNVYWWQRVQESSVDGSILTCPMTGCIDSPQTVLTNIGFGPMSVDEEYLYWGSGSDSAVLRYSLTRQSKVEVIALNLFASHVIAGDAHVYWDEPLPADRPHLEQTQRVIRRAPKTGDQPPQTLVEDQARGALVIDDKFVYWAVERPDGAIFRCPLSGCEGAPMLLIADQQMPTALVTDGRTMTWVNVAGWGFGRGPDLVRGSVMHCNVEACAATLQTWSTQTFPSSGISLAADDSDVYWIATNSDEIDRTDTFARRTIYRHAH